MVTPLVRPGDPARVRGAAMWESLCLHRVAYGFWGFGGNHGRSGQKGRIFGPDGQIRKVVFTTLF